MRKSVDKDPMLLSGELQPASGLTPIAYSRSHVEGGAYVSFVRLEGLRDFGLWLQVSGRLSPK